MRDVGGEGRGDVPGFVWIGLAFGTGVVVLSALGAMGGGLSLPALFVSLAAVMLILGLIALWQSLRAAFGGGPEAFGSASLGLPERDALLEEKAHLLRAIKDIAFEREVGKISDEDFARLDKAYRQRAKEVLFKLDQDLEPYLKKAERLVSTEAGGAPGKGKKRPKKKAKRARPTVECDACGSFNDLDAAHCKECGARLKPFDCPSCGTENDPDAKFCKSCATSLVKGGSEARAEAAAGAATSGTATSGAVAKGADAAEADAERSDAEDADVERAEAAVDDGETEADGEGAADASAAPDSDAEAAAEAEAGADDQDADEDRDR